MHSHNLLPDPKGIPPSVLSNKDVLKSRVLLRGTRGTRRVTRGTRSARGTRRGTRGTRGTRRVSRKSNMVISSLMCHYTLLYLLLFGN